MVPCIYGEQRTPQTPNNQSWYPGGGARLCLESRRQYAHQLPNLHGNRTWRARHVVVVAIVGAFVPHIIS